MMKKPKNPVKFMIASSSFSKRSLFHPTVVVFLGTRVFALCFLGVTMQLLRSLDISPFEENGGFRACELIEKISLEAIDEAESL